MKLLALLLAFGLFGAFSAAAKEHGHSKEKRVMPVAAGGQFEEAQSFKKALDESLKGPSLKEQLVDALKDMAGLVRPPKKVENEKKAEPQRGDPKTSFSRSENKLHSARHAPPPAGTPSYDVTNYLSWSAVETETTVMRTYRYDDETSPFDTVNVTYDKTTGAVVSAFGFKSSFLSELPDLSLMALVSTAYALDGSLKMQAYESTAPDGTVTRIVLRYEAGVLSDARLTLVTPLDSNDILPAY